jgi:hypothetical protein
MKRVLIVAAVTAMLGGVVVASPAAAVHKHGPRLCLMDGTEC